VGSLQDFFYDLFFAFLKERGHSRTLIFDEIDFLRDDDVLYNFSRSGEFKEFNERQFIQIIGVPNKGNL
jgi:archaeal cell division control protein 6